jgi:hypothetical protein
LYLRQRPKQESGANFKTIKKRHTGEIGAQKRAENTGLRYASLRVYFSPERQQQTFEIGSQELKAACKEQ